ncbi:MAG: PqqD family protein [Acidimicrobiia bacterium]
MVARILAGLQRVEGFLAGKRIGPPPEHIIETEVQGDVSLYDAKREQVVVLNATASDVWRLCDGEQTLDEIVSLLASAYQADASTIRPDVEKTVAELVEAGFLPGE